MNAITKTKITIIKNKMFDVGFLDKRKREFPQAHRGMLRMDYIDAKELIKLLPADEAEVALKQLKDAYARALQYLD